MKRFDVSSALKSSNANKRRKLSRSRANDAMITLIKEAKAAFISMFCLTAGLLPLILYAKSEILDMMLLP